MSPARGTAMNRGCVFASRARARCGTLQKCGQAVAAAAAAETASQEPSPASPASRRCGRTLGESLQTSSGRGEDAGSPSGGTGGRAGALPSRVPSPCHLRRQGCPRRWAPALEGRRSRRALGSCSGSLASGQAPLAFPPATLRPVLAGITASSPPLPQVTAAAFAARAGGRGAVRGCGPSKADFPGTT